MKINHIIKEFVTPQATAQDPGLEREKDVDVVFFGQMPRDFTADTVAEALEAVLPREYPPGSSDTTNSNVYRVVTEIAKHQGAVVTTKPLSIAQKLVKTFQTYGIKCRIDAPGLEEGDVVQFHKKHKSDLEDTHSCVKCGGDLQGGTYMGHKVKVCMPCKQVYLPPNTGIDQRGNKVDEQGVAEMDSQGYKGTRDDYELGKGKEHTGKTITAKGMVDAAKQAWDYATEPVDAPDMHTYKRNRAKNIAAIRKNKGVDEGTAGLPDPNDFGSDWEYQDAMDAYGKTQDTDSDFENMIDEPDDWFDESKEKVGNMDADAFDDALARLKKLAGAGPLKTVYDPNKRVYKNVPTAVQPAQQPKKAR